MTATRRITLLWIILLSAVVLIESSIPFMCAEAYSPSGYSFSGQVSYSPDQNMYFSFISQARDGAFILKDKLTSIPHQPVFINLEYWLVGFLQHITGLSENAVYHVWRFLGLLLLVVGFNLLTRIFFPESPRRRLMALAMFLFAGGFGFVFAILDHFHLIGFDATHNGIIDMRYGILPFQQLITNPHMSFPHGLILIAYAYFLLGVQHNKVRYYVWSGIIFNLIGLVRPYDIIPPCIIFPVYVLMTNGGYRLNLKLAFLKMLPLFMIVPVFLYNLWLFKYHAIFKHWSLQGHNAGVFPSVVWHYMAYGVIGLLAIMRMTQLKKYPPGTKGKFLLLWFGVTFVFIHLGKYIPAIGWSPQIGVYLAAPLTIAACSLRLEDILQSRLYRNWLIAGLAGILIVSNLSLMMYHSRKFVLGVNTESFYVANDDMTAMEWLRKSTKPGSVVMADVYTSQVVAKYTSNAVVAAHYSVTPDFALYSGKVAALLKDTSAMWGLVPLPADLHVDYVYVHDRLPMQNSKYLKEVYRNSGAFIYQVVPN